MIPENSDMLMTCVVSGGSGQWRGARPACRGIHTATERGNVTCRADDCVTEINDADLEVTIAGLLGRTVFRM